MAGKTDTSATLFAQKKLLGKAHTSNLKIDGEEVIGSNIQTSTNLVFGDVIPNSPTLSLYTTQTAPGSSYDAVEYIQFVLTPLTGTTYDANDPGGGSGSDPGEASQVAGPHAYKFVLPSNYESLTNNARAGNGVFNNSRLVHETLGQLQLIPPFYSQDAPNPYIVKIYKDNGSGAAGDEIPLLDNIDWNVDYYNGILFVQDYNATKIPAFARAFAYVGRMANEVISSISGSGGGGGGGDVDAQYLVLASSTALNNERVFTTGTGLKHQDSGAGHNYSVSIDDSIVATISGATFDGSVKFKNGLSGSLTKLSDGTPYLIGGTNVTVINNPNGSITISSIGGGGGGGGGINVRTSWMETPTGDVDGSNTIFGLAYAPAPPSALQLYVNGIMQSGNGNDYFLTGDSFVMSYAPQLGSSIFATYPYEYPLPATMWLDTITGDVDGVNNVFVLTNSPNPSEGLMFYVNGILQRQGASYDYTLLGNTITMNYVPPAGANISATYPY